MIKVRSEVADQATAYIRDQIYDQFWSPYGSKLSSHNWNLAWRELESKPLLRRALWDQIRHLIWDQINKDL